MATESEKIRELKRLLKQAEQRAEKAEAAARKAQQLASDHQNRYEIQTDCYGQVTAVVMTLMLIVEECRDIPQASRDELRRLVMHFKKELDRIPAISRAFARMFKRGSERIGHDTAKEAEENAGKFAEATASLVRTVKTRTRRMSRTLQTVAQAAAELESKANGDEVLGAAARIANAPEPKTPEDSIGKSMGRQSPNVLTPEKEEDVPGHPTHCPKCNSDRIEIGDFSSQNLRILEDSIKQLSTYRHGSYRQLHCACCGRVSIINPSNRFPVAPGRTLEQAAVVTAGVAWSSGVALHKFKDLTTSAQDQLGHETVHKNVSDWAGTAGADLVAQIGDSLKSEPVVEADGTVMPIGESQGKGVCKDRSSKQQTQASNEAQENSEQVDQPDSGANAQTRQKDYIEALSTPRGVERPATIFTLLNGRGQATLENALAGLKPEVLVTDGYAPYSRICAEHNWKRQSCLVHARRKVLDAVMSSSLHQLGRDAELDTAQAIEDAKGKLSSGSAEYLLCIVLQGYCKLYGYEKDNIRQENESPEAWASRVKANRQRLSKPLMDDMDAIMEHLAKQHCKLCRTGGDGEPRYECVNKSDVSDAVTYYMNQRKSFRTFLDDARVPPDTNQVERNNRAVAVLRSAINKMQGRQETERLCIWLSLKETAEANGINDPIKWLTEYGRAWYRYCAEKTLTKEVTDNGRSLNSKLMKFNPGASEGFDYEPWLPWNYAKHQDETEE